MTAKEYLLQINYCQKRIKQKLEEATQLRDMTIGIRAVTIDENKVQTSPEPDRIGESVIKIIECENEIADLVDKYIELRMKIIHQIEDMDNQKYSEILYLRYVLDYNMTEVSGEIGYSIRNTKYLHKEALRDFSEKYLKK